MRHWLQCVVSPHRCSQRQHEGRAGPLHWCWGWRFPGISHQVSATPTDSSRSANEDYSVLRVCAEGVGGDGQGELHTAGTGRKSNEGTLSEHVHFWKEDWKLNFIIFSRKVNLINKCSQWRVQKIFFCFHSSTTSTSN